MKKTLLLILSMVFCVTINAKVSLDFTNAANEWNFPSSTSAGAAIVGTETSFTNGTYTVYLYGASGNGCYANSGYIMICNSGSYIKLQGFDFAVGTIVVGGHSGGSASATMNIYVGDTAVSTECKDCTADHTFEIAEGYQTANTQYICMNTSSKNYQVTTIDVYAVGEEIGNDTPTGHGYEADDPYTCEEAIEIISALASGGTITDVYVKGIVSTIGTYNSSWGELIYYISDDGTTSNQLEIYDGYYLNNEKFTSNYANELMVGDEVIVYGTFTNYYGNTPEGSMGATYIYSLTRNGETVEPDDGHTFNFADNTYGMTVYTSGNDYETEVTQIVSDGVVLNFNSGHYRIWNSSGEGNHIRIGGSGSNDAYCTISGPAGSKVLEVVLTSTGSSDNMSASNPTADPEGISDASHVCTWTGEAESVTFHFTAVTHIYYIDVTLDTPAGDFTITSVGYATYYTDEEYTMPEGVVGTTITGIEDLADDGGYILDAAWEYEAGSTVPAQTALVLKGEEGTYTYTVTSTGAEAPEDNLLQGSSTEVLTTGPDSDFTGYYFYELTVGEYGVGFYWANEEGSAFTSEAHKAWLAMALTHPAKFIGFGEGSTTGISAVESSPATDAIYTIQGVRVSDMRQKGIYIVGGKKVLVK